MWRGRLPWLALAVFGLFLGLRRLGRLREPRVFCWIVTGSRFHASRAAAVRDTWARRCDGWGFVSDSADPALPTFATSRLPDDHRFLWHKTKTALRHLFATQLHAYDWFLKADDDTFVVVENLRKFLRGYDPEVAHFLGCQFVAPAAMPVFGNLTFNSGGAGYALSRVALGLVGGEVGPGGLCNGLPFGPEDLLLASCLAKLRVPTEYTRDGRGCLRFLPLLPSALLGSSRPPDDFWLFQYSKHPVLMGVYKGEDCCAEDLVSFHRVNDSDMRLLDMLRYRIR